MRDRVSRAVEDLDRRAGALPEGEREAVAEAARLMEWLRDDNFIFLGIRDYDYRGERERRDRWCGARATRPRHPVRSRRARARPAGGEPVTTTPEIRAFLKAATSLIVTKANVPLAGPPPRLHGLRRRQAI